MLKQNKVAMASLPLLALSVLWIIPNSPCSMAWMTPIAPVARIPTAKSGRWPTLLASTVTQVVDSEESLEHLTVPELKEKLRSRGQKVTGKKSELIQRLMIDHPGSSDDTTTQNEVHDNGNSDSDTHPNTIWDISADIPNLDPSLQQMPEPLITALIKYASQNNAGSASHESSPTTTTKLLPIQLKSYQIVSKGNDAVLFSPTGTGKSLAFILPLAARLYEWKHDGSLNYKKEAQKQRFRKQARMNRNDSFSSDSVEAATPSILIVEPSRELARQVGKVWGKFHPTATKSSKRQVVTVYGGVPMQRHAAMLGGKTDVVVGTPGRIRELIREKYLSTSHIRSIVLDEADTLLDFKDNPEVEWLLDGMQNDYQLVLASATVNQRVEKFVGEVMELEVGEEGYVIVDDDNGGMATADDAPDDDGGISVDGITEVNGKIQDESSSNKKLPAVRHWSMPASPANRITLTSDLVVTMTPRRGIVFAPSKAEVESVAQQLTERLSANDVSIHILHGDMVQAARSRTVIAFRGDPTSRMTRILVATDVAARGLDLPAVDLVLQFGVPRENGKDGTYDSELYIHRTGRAGRFGNTRTADAILLYDRSQGEMATLNKLEEEMKDLKGVEIKSRQLPSPSEVMEASYDRVLRLCDGFGTRAQADEAGDGTQSLVQYFADKLSKDDSSDESFEDGTSDKESLLVHRLATAMAALSGLEAVVPPRSLLTADPKDRTIRVRNDSHDANNPLSPSEVTKVVKSLGSGKLGRISMHDDGSAVFDLTALKAERLLQNAASDADLDTSGWHFDMPATV